MQDYQITILQGCVVGVMFPVLKVRGWINYWEWCGLCSWYGKWIMIQISRS